MTVPLWVRCVAAAIGGLLLLFAWSTRGPGFPPGSAPVVPARLCLRSGFVCFREVARMLGLQAPGELDLASGISLSYQEFLQAVERLRAVDFPIEREPAEAWPDFVGWRATYERAAYAVAAEIDAVPALWSGPRRSGDPAIAPTRPPAGHPLSAPEPGLPEASPDNTDPS